MSQTAQTREMGILDVRCLHGTCHQWALSLGSRPLYCAACAVTFVYCLYARVYSAG